jgi:hypothetical protein
MSELVALRSAAGTRHDALRRGSFWVLRDDVTEAPRHLFVGCRRLTRFMDRIYLPAAVHDLSPGLVAELCELRLELMSSLSNDSLRRQVVATVLMVGRRACRGPRRVMDFGTGDGSLLSSIAHVWQSPVWACGVDMSLLSLRRSDCGNSVCVSGYGPLPFIDGAFDLVFAVFVLHFRLPSQVLIELSRVVSGRGRLVANVYGVAVDAYEAEMRGSGWEQCGATPVEGAPGHRVDVWRVGDT